MIKLPAFVLSAFAATVAGAAIAAAPASHKMDVPLPDGAVAHIEYVGDVAPKVTVAPAPGIARAGPWAIGLPSFAGFDRMMQEMNRQTEQMVRQAQQVAAQSGGAGIAAPYVAAYGNVPPGGTSTTVVSVTNGGKTCTRTTEVVAQGAGKPPRVSSKVSGQCDATTVLPTPPQPPSRASNPA